MTVDSGIRSPNRLLSCLVSPAETTEWAEHPMSPTGRVMEDVGVYIILVMGLGMRLDLPVFRNGIETEMITRFPRFQSIQVMLLVLTWVV
jgi:hypothetical protein